MIILIRNFILFLLAFWSGTMVGQDKPQFAIANIDSALISHADAVIRSEETKYIIESPREFIQHVSKTVSIFNENSEESYVIVPYNKYSKADLISVVLYDASGKFLRKIKKSEIIDQAVFDGSIMNDERYMEVRTFGGQLPYTLEYEWQITHHQTMQYGDWLPQDIEESVEKATFIMDAPENLLIHTKTLNHNFQYSKKMINGRNIQTWTIENNKAIRHEEFGPPAHELLPTVLISPSVFQVDEYTGSMSDWKSFGAFLYELNKEREKMSPSMVMLIQQMTSQCNTPREQIDTLYHWLQKNMRYVSVQLGIGGWQAFDAAYVEKNRYGDCKALSTFMKGMLKEVGIDSWQVIIKWDEDENLFFDDFMSLDFNHMMLHIPQENMWLECTSNYLPTGAIDIDEENKKVLLLTPEGGKIATTPTSSSSLNQVSTIDTIRITDELRIKGRKQYTGNVQDVMRSLKHYASPEEQREFFLEKFPLSVKKLERFDISTDRNGEKSIMEYTATLSQFGSSSGNRYFIPVNSIYPSLTSCPSDPERKTDYISKLNYTKTNDIYISLAEGYEIEYLPAVTHFDFQGNHYTVEIKSENGFIHVHHQQVESPMRLTPDQYRELCSYYNAVFKSNNQMIVLKKSKA